MLDRTDNAPTAANNTRCQDILPLTVDGLGYQRGQQKLLHDISFDIASSNITLIMGPNGAGKSVLLRLLHGLDEPNVGAIQWGQFMLTHAMLRKRQAMVFQKPVLLRRSAAANVDFALRLNGPADHDRRNHLMQIVGLEGREQRPARSLSGGEQQRLALARALATSPDVLFLDEPTANLDPASTQIIEEIVLSESQAGTKIIFVTHDIGQAQRLAADVLFLHRGRLAEHSTAEAFFKEPQSEAARDYLAGRIVL